MTVAVTLGEQCEAPFKIPDFLCPVVALSPDATGRISARHHDYKHQVSGSSLKLNLYLHPFIYGFTDLETDIKIKHLNL